MHRKLLEVIVGSKAYGTNIESSDIDLKMVHQCSNEELFLFNYRPQIEYDKDTVSYEIKRFLELLMGANPNILELLFTDSAFIPYIDSRMNPLFENRLVFLTKKTFQSFGQYAITQIRKATALDKKINWEKERITRKGVLDFCYILIEKEKSCPFNKSPYADMQERLGLAKVNNFPDMYAMYELEDDGGIIEERSNDVQLRSIPKGSKFLSYIRFDKNAYSMHCKDYKEYLNWLENRNTNRYTWDIKKQVYDMKNLMHCRRLLDMALEIGESGNLTIFRPNRAYLLDIRMGNVDVNDLFISIKTDQEKLYQLFEASQLPEEVNKDFINDFLIGIRKSVD